MWDQQKHQRFQQLRQCESNLTEAERAELTSLVQELEAAESTFLTGATEGMRQERETIETQNLALEELVLRKKSLAQRLSSVLAESRSERSAIETELASVLANGQRLDSVE